MNHKVKILIATLAFLVLITFYINHGSEEKQIKAEEKCELNIELVHSSHSEMIYTIDLYQQRCQSQENET